MIDTLLAYAAPHSCCGCGVVGLELCEGCKYDIVSEGFSSCIGCLCPIASSNLCNRCREYKAASIWCVGLRQGSLKNLLDYYKFDAMRSAARPLAELLDAAVPLLPADVVVTVVPTAPAHNRERGFDHMERVGRAFAGLRKLPYVPLLKRRGGDTQHFKTKQQRRDAAKGLFEVLPGALPGKVLILDDILTTGYTLRAALDVLDESGVGLLYGGIIAKQPLDGSPDLW